MEDINAELKKKKERLAELLKVRANYACSASHSSKANVERETEIEELEEEIKILESKL